ncbi:sugar-binding domain-containing protein [Winogradskyella thalassocola]|uniref:beta-galactosidase n=1 Tax=Winogradskyella thalassocola TaxID=262004 RepID=A0A1G7WF07_9FLAO|nr:sugar-binding domain-containing protein [Winogradskyella thalassocola]SDG70635.1 Glycosyl hydrolases family 2, TIM barrel domain [Winogradskyella thalassocola]
MCSVILTLLSCRNELKQSIDLSGHWSFKIDSLDLGEDEKWFNNKLQETIMLPGSMAENGKGNDISVSTNWTGNMWNDSLWYKDPKMKKYREKDNVKVPFWLTPNKHYVGAAWYQKTIEIPKSWGDKELSLYLERAHWESTIWIDGKLIGKKNSLATAHHYVINTNLSEGKHLLTLRVDNRIKDIDVGLDAHSISDNTQTNWNGVVGDVKLIAKPKISFGNVKLYPNIDDNSVKVVVEIKNASNKEHQGQLTLQANLKNGNSRDLLQQIETIQIHKNQEITFNYNIGDDLLLWDEFNPNVYEMNLTLESVAGVDTKLIDFGMRNFKADGTIFTINNRQVFLRGTLECAIFPLTGYPPTDVDSWDRIFKIIKNHGLNHMRFHSWCPPEAAFIAADKAGVYLQVEASAWTTIGDGKPIDRWLYKEAQDIIDAYGNHPSFVMMAYGNEPSGKNHKAYLKDFVAHFKAVDNRRVYTGAAGWPLIDNLDFYNNSKPRIQGWNQNLNSIINTKSPQTEFDYSELINKTPMPYVSHEIGQWCVYPNFKEMSKYTGVLKPKNFEIFKATLQENNMEKLADSFLLASGKLQTLCYKADIEAALRTKDMAGFQLLDLHDFTGQGTALVGVLDAFWDEKGYVSPQEFRAFSNQTVPLARLGKRVFKNGDTLKVNAEVAHFGSKSLEGVTAQWKITNAWSTIAEGAFDKRNIPIGNGFVLGKIVLPLINIDKAQKLTITISVEEFKNSWDVWVYPSELKPTSNGKNIRVVSKFDDATIKYLIEGGNVLLNVAKGDIAAEKGGDIAVGFSSIFWNTSWTKEQKPHTLGILCDPEHSALSNFPTEYHSNWQWWDAMSNSNAVILDDFPEDLNPIIRVIDDWFKNRKTALIFEAKVGKGKLIMSGIDLHTNLDNRLEAKQLLYSLETYMASENFSPQIEVPVDKINDLLNYK